MDIIKKLTVLNELQVNAQFNCAVVLLTSQFQSETILWYGLPFGYTQVVFLPGCCTQTRLAKKESEGNEEMSVYEPTSPMLLPLQSGIPAIIRTIWREQTMGVLQKAMTVVVVLQQNC